MLLLFMKWCSGLNVFANILLIALLPLLSYGQQTCSCPKEVYNNQTGKTYQFNNGRTLGICGYYEKGIYSELALIDCSSKSIIEQWDALQDYKITFANDTLQLSNLYLLPVGKRLVYKQAPFLIYKYYFAGNKLLRTSYYNKAAVLYSNNQISHSLEKYKKAKRGNTEDNVEVADILFCAYVSGSKQAENYLKQLKTKLGPFDGAIAEQWNSIWQLYLQYKTQTDKPLQKEVLQ